GVRENGGQYSHAAMWSVMAFAALGDGDKAGELFSILNPINRASTRASVYRYKVEPYVVAADVYAEPPHVGRGGWTWYTGAAGTSHHVAVVLGDRPQGPTRRGRISRFPALRVAQLAWRRERLPGFQQRPKAGDDQQPTAVELGVGVLAQLVVGHGQPA